MVMKTDRTSPPTLPPSPSLKFPTVSTGLIHRPLVRCLRRKLWSVQNGPVYPSKRPHEQSCQHPPLFTGGVLGENTSTLRRNFLVVSCLVISYLEMSPCGSWVGCLVFAICLVLSCLNVSCHGMSCLVVACICLYLCLALFSKVFSYLFWSFLVVSFLFLSWLALSCHISSCLVLSCLVWSCHVVTFLTP